MAKTAIVTDSVACVSEELVKKYNIYVAPIEITWGKQVLRDSIDITPKEFYARLRTDPIHPKTSGGVVGEFVKIFEGLKGKVDGVVTIVVSGALSAVLSSAQKAAELVSDLHVEHVDSRTLMMAEGFVALEAAKAAAKGGSMKEVADAARKVVPKTHCIWAMETLDYIRRGGRIIVSEEILAGWQGFKPIVAVIDGKFVPVAKTVTRPQAVDKLLELIAADVKGSSPLHASVIHGDVPGDAEQFKKQVSAKFNCAELTISEMTPVLGVHMGPGTLGLAFYQE